VREPTGVLLATWNVNSLRAHERGVLAWLAASDIDVLAMQETMCEARSFPRKAFEALGYEVAVVGTGGRSGVAIASRVGVDNQMLGVPGAVAPFDQPRFVAATCGGVRVVNLYAPNGRKVGADEHRVKLAWFQFVGSVIEDEIADGPMAVLADLNIAPTDTDVWDASRYRSRNLTSPVERRAFREFCDRGLVDVVRRDAGGASTFTWWNRRGDFFDSDRGWRLDHVLASTDLAERMTLVGVDRSARETAGTDHAPLTVRVSRGSTA
jgi:exodeoxyribonuclease III